MVLITAAAIRERAKEVEELLDDLKKLRKSAAGPS